MIQLSRWSQYTNLWALEFELGINLTLELDLILIDDIRAASRQMVRELGFMDATVAASDYPPSAVHTILEIGMRGPMTSAELAEFLHLEKSSVSRLVRKLIDGGELKENPDADDARFKPLSLTPKGRRTLAALHVFGRQQVSGAIARLTDAERRTVREGLLHYARALKADRAEMTEAVPQAIA
jgi:DNA-binding MarR family transcriptional regulator